MKRALVVGINRFQFYPESTLHLCLKDAELMAEAFRERGCEVEQMLDGAAADFYIINKIQEFYQEAIKSDSFYIGLWFSSHGSHYQSSYEADGLGEGLCCHNLLGTDEDWSAGFIKDRTFRNLLNRFPKHGLVEIGFDTCFSGGMDRLWPGPNHLPRFMHNPGNKGKAMRMANSTFSGGPGLNPNIIMWQACSEAEVSYDGAFTPAFAQVIREHPEYSRLEVLLAVREILSGNKFRQTPRLKAWNAMVQTKVGE